MDTQRYKIYLMLECWNIFHEWAQQTSEIFFNTRENFVSPSNHIIFFLLYKIFINTYQCCWWFPTTLWRFLKIFQILCKGQTNFSKHFLNISKHFMKIAEDNQRLPRLMKTSKEDPKMYSTPTNLSVVKGTKKIIKNDIFTCEDII